MARLEDPMYVVFRDLFAQKFQAPYQYQKNDFIRLAALKKSLELSNGHLPDKWSETCKNYLETPQGKLTLADMCLRYGIFKRSSLNQFNRPEQKDLIAQPAAPREKLEWHYDAEGNKVAVIVPIAAKPH